MKQYLELVRTILDTGRWQENRTGIRTISMPGAMMRFDLQQGFPAVTTKKLAFKSAIGEMVGFPARVEERGGFPRARLQGLGRRTRTKTRNGSRIRIAKARTISARSTACSGASGRRTRCIDATRGRADRRRARIAAFRSCRASWRTRREKVLLYKAIDQLRQCLDTIVKNPAAGASCSMRWNPAKLDAVALPACHLLYQFIPNAASERFRCASISAAMTSGWARRSTWPKARRCCIWSAG